MHTVGQSTQAGHYRSVVARLEAPLRVAQRSHSGVRSCARTPHGAAPVRTARRLALRRAMGLSASSIPGSSQSTVLATPQLRARFRPRQAHCQLACSLPGTTAGRLQAEKHRSALLRGRIQASGVVPRQGIAQQHPRLGGHWRRGEQSICPPVGLLVHHTARVLLRPCGTSGPKRPLL